MSLATKQIALLITSTSLLFAATAPNIGDAIKQVQPPRKATTTAPSLMKLKGAKENTLIKDSSSKTVAIKSFKIIGATHIDVKYLQKLIATYNNKDLTFKQLKEVASIITKEYREQGYFVARAYLPIQDISKNKGVATIAIVEGAYGKMKLKNNSLVKDSIIQAMLDNSKKDSAISTNSLERSLLIINDTPGAIISKTDVMPGAVVGTSDFDIQADSTNRVNGYIIADNYGSRYTGKNRLMAGVSVNSPFKIGDKLSVNGLISNGEDLGNGRVAYSLPLMSNGLRAEVSYSKTTYSLTDTYESLDAKGDSKTLDTTLSYPIIRSRTSNLRASLNLAKKDLKDEIDSTNDITKKNIKSLTLGLDYDKYYFTSVLPTSLKVNFHYTYGKLGFDDDAKRVDDENGADTNGYYSKVNLDISHDIQFTQKLSLSSSIRFQYALNDKNLDGSEDLSIGGAYGVKLYPDSEVSAENGYVFNIEAKYKLPNFNTITNSVGVFYDRGRAYMANNTVDYKAKSLQDVGVGYYITGKNFFGRAQVAWNANSPEVTSEPVRNSRVLVNGGWVF